MVKMGEAYQIPLVYADVRSHLRGAGWKYGYDDNEATLSQLWKPAQPLRGFRKTEFR